MIMTDMSSWYNSYRLITSNIVRLITSNKYRLSKSNILKLQTLKQYQYSEEVNGRAAY